MTGLPWTIPGGQQILFTPHTISGRGGGDAVVTGTGGLRSENFETGVAGWSISGDGNVEFNDGTFRGTLDGVDGTFVGVLEASSINIGGGDATSFQVDAAGNVWIGAATFATAPFRVSSVGALDVGGVDATSLHADVDGNFWLGAATFATAPFRITSAGRVDVGGDDATSLHISTAGNLHVGAAAADYATAPLKLSNAGVLTIYNSATDAGVQLYTTGSIAVLALDSGGASLIAAAQIYGTSNPGPLEALTIRGPQTTAGGTPSVSLISDVALSRNYIQLFAGVLTIISPGVMEVQANGSVSAPAISIGDLNNGFYASNDDTVDIAANGVRIAAFYDDGQIDFRYGTMYSGIGGTHFISFYYSGGNLRGVVKNAGGATVADLVIS